jgi:hypothetical protein
MTTLANITYSGVLRALTCGACGMPFGLPSAFLEARQSDGALFHCPNGHRIGYGESDADRLRREKADLERRMKWKQDAIDSLYAQRTTLEHRVAAQKGVTTKLKKRIANGVCPCCKRTFADLHRHMSGQHPDYVAAKSEDSSS